MILERLTHQSRNGYHNAAMEWGIQTEPQAHRAYALETDSYLFYADDGLRLWLPHPTIAMAGATPDAIKYRSSTENGIVEFKCPFESGVHLEYYDDGISKSSYRSQGLFQLACAPDAKWVDLVSYDPRMPVKMQLIIQRTYRKDVEAEILQLNFDLLNFLREVDERMKRYEQ